MEKTRRDIKALARRRRQTLIWARPEPRDFPPGSIQDRAARTDTKRITKLLCRHDGLFEGAQGLPGAAQLLVESGQLIRNPVAAKFSCGVTAVALSRHAARFAALLSGAVRGADRRGPAQGLHRPPPALVRSEGARSIARANRGRPGDPAPRQGGQQPHPLIHLLNFAAEAANRALRRLILVNG
mgnify:CR=1 FL=1